jgi:hypothetical protein
MARFWWQHEVGLLRRRITVLAALCVYLFAIIGFPVPETASSPCSGQACGCPSEDSCRGNCCCSTPGRGLVLATTQRNGNSGTVSGAFCSHCNQYKAEGCCQPGGSSSCCEPKQPAGGSCCSTDSTTPSCAVSSPQDQPSEPEAAVAEEEERSSGVRWVAGISAQGCQGGNSLWTSLNEPISSPPNTVALNHRGTEVVWMYQDSLLIPFSHSFSPLIPPPRV